MYVCTLAECVLQNVQHMQQEVAFSGAACAAVAFDAAETVIMAVNLFDHAAAAAAVADKFATVRARAQCHGTLLTLQIYIHMLGVCVCVFSHALMRTAS